MKPGVRTGVRISGEAPAGGGLVWKTGDADAVWRYLESQDIDGDPPPFYRPVQLPDGSTAARFTVRLRPALVPNGRSFSASMRTPQGRQQRSIGAASQQVTDIMSLWWWRRIRQPPRARIVYLVPISSPPASRGAFVLKAGVATVRFAAALVTRAPDYGSARMARADAAQQRLTGESQPAAGRCAFPRRARRHCGQRNRPAAWRCGFRRNLRF